jgi:peptide/nickel transport system substrate-binding protein
MTHRPLTWLGRRGGLLAVGVGGVAAVTLALTGCSGASAPSDSSSSSADSASYQSGGSFSMDLGSDPGTVSPYESTGGFNRQIYAFMYDSLVGRGADGAILPQLAKSWKTSGSQVTYTLNKGITCSDGTKLEASDIAADFNFVKNAPYQAWLSLTVPVPYTATADDSANTVTIKTDQPFGLLTQGAGSLPIVCPAGIKDPKSIQHASQGTGPYKITDYVQNDHYTLTANPGYKWGPNGATNSYPGAPKTVTISFVAAEATMANSLISGQINAAQITGPDRARLDATPTLKKYSVPVIQGELLQNQNTGKLLADPQLRIAVSTAIDRAPVAKVGTDGRGKVATNIAVEKPVLCPGDETTGNLPAYNTKKAKSLLDADGWTMGSDGIRHKDGKDLVLGLDYVTGAPQTAAAVELLGQQLKAVGIETKITGLTNAAGLGILYTTLDFDLYYTGVTLEFPFMYSAFFGGPNPQAGGRNSASINNEKFTSLSKQALAESGKKGCALWTEAHKALLKTADVIPISQGDRPFYASKATLTTIGLFAVPTSIRLLK